jgi:hypothetical protein
VFVQAGHLHLEIQARFARLGEFEKLFQNFLDRKRGRAEKRES